MPVVHRLEFAAVDDNARFGKKAYLAAERDEARAQLANSRAIVLAEIGDPSGSGTRLPNNQIASKLRPASRSSRRLALRANDDETSTRSR